MLNQKTLLSRAGSTAFLALACVFSSTAFAAENAASHAAGFAALPGAGSTRPAEIFADAQRVYPPSCLVDGLPFGKSSAYTNVQTVALTLQSYDSTTGGYTPEVESVSIWRVPCSGGSAATVVELDRPTASNGNTSQYPIFPSIYITTTATGTNRIYPRMAQEPNTHFADTAAQFTLDKFSFFYNSTIFVLEHYDASNPHATPAVDYNQAFTLNFDNLASGGLPLVVNVPAYAPPPGNTAMEISGYLSTNWSNPTEGADGIVLQVYDNGDKATRTLAFAWFTYDDAGLPFWLYGQTSLNIGDTTATAPTVYFTGGAFAGSSGGGTQKSWGTVKFAFPDCGHMTIQYNGDASAVHGPKGNASATFLRVADVNSLVCQ